MISLTRKLIVIALSIVTSIALAYSLFGLGFMVCTTPQATSLIGGTFSGWEHATYPEEDMAQIAEAVRSFSIEGTSSEELYNTIFTALQETQPQIAALFEAGSTQDNTIDTSLLESTNLAQLEEEYSLPRNALSPARLHPYLHDRAHLCWSSGSLWNCGACRARYPRRQKTLRRYPYRGILFSNCRISSPRSLGGDRF